MKIKLPETDKIGAEITDLDARHLEASAAREILQVVYEHKLVVFRDQHLTPPEYIDLARRFGEPQIYFQPNYHHPDHPEIFVSANIPLGGEKVGVAGTGRYWHTDYQFFEEPLPTTMVYPQRIPKSARQTYYIDMERVLRLLPADKRTALEGRRARHEAKLRYKVQASDIDKSIAELMAQIEAIAPPVTHPAIITHPVTGKQSLYVSEGFTTGLVGLEPSFLTELLEFVAREEHVHTHNWTEGDILFWDNRTLIHMASTVSSGEASVSFRIGVYDGLPFYVQP